MKANLIAAINIAQSLVGQKIRKFMHIALVLGCAFGLVIATAGCHKEGNGDNVTPQTTTTTNTGEYFSQCKVSTYDCYGNTANLTALERDYNGNPLYSFVFAMKVGGNQYADLSIVVSLKSFPGKGKYTLTATNTDVAYNQRLSGDSFASSKVTGIMEITDYQPKKSITGTFVVNATEGTRALDLKEGKFKVEAEF